MTKQEKTIKTYEVVCETLQHISYDDKMEILQAAMNIVDFQEALKKAQNK